MKVTNGSRNCECRNLPIQLPTYPPQAICIPRPFRLHFRLRLGPLGWWGGNTGTGRKGKHSEDINNGGRRWKKGGNDQRGREEERSSVMAIRADMRSSTGGSLLWTNLSRNDSHTHTFTLWHSCMYAHMRTHTLHTQYLANSYIRRWMYTLHKHTQMQARSLTWLHSHIDTHRGYDKLQEARRRDGCAWMSQELCVYFKMHHISF